MDFPAYVPAAVRTYITALIEGDSRNPQGWAASLASAEQQLADIEGRIQSCIRWGKDDYLPGLEVDRAQAAKHRDMLKENENCLRRLAFDKRMKGAYTVLTREFTDDKQWCSFIYAAWAAWGDFSEYRDQLKRATKLKAEIAEVADSLAELIRQFAETKVLGPGEFFSIPALLRGTDNHEMQGHNLHMWQSMRKYILGDLPERDIPASKVTGEITEPQAAPKIIIKFVGMGDKPHIDPKEEARNTLRYAWGTAPDFPALLDTLANAARNFKPSESGMIGAAIESRQRNQKTQYLRAFGSLLINGYGFAMTMPIKQAMAIVANVVINQPDVDVTYDDVRKTLSKLGSERLENSDKK